MDTDTTYTPEGPGGPRRGLFTRRPDAPETRPVPTQRTSALDLAIAERLDDGLRAIEEHAATLMREIATEMWRTSGADTADEQDPDPQLHLAGPGHQEPHRGERRPVPGAGAPHGSPGGRPR